MTDERFMGRVWFACYIITALYLIYRLFPYGAMSLDLWLLTLVPAAIFLLGAFAGLRWYPRTHSRLARVALYLPFAVIVAYLLLTAFAVLFFSIDMGINAPANY